MPDLSSEKDFSPLWVDRPIPRIGSKLWLEYSAELSFQLYHAFMSSSLYFSLSGAPSAIAVVGAVDFFVFTSRSQVRARTRSGLPEARREEETHLLEQSGACEF